jgi:hypothetical protein
LCKAAGPGFAAKVDLDAKVGTVDAKVFNNEKRQVNESACHYAVGVLASPSHASPCQTVPLQSKP